MASSVTTGSLVAEFRVQSLIGEGAMGSVYLARDTRTGVPVALKLLASDLSGDERFRQRFARESGIVAALDHPHIVRTISSGEADGSLFLAMAYVEGSDLHDVLEREGRLEPARACGLVAQAAGALDAAHRAGLVHRDVKPGNILIEPGPAGEHAYVCDFGLARHVSSVSSLTGERGLVGTVDYISPEQIEGRAVDRKSDVYSLGCLLFECLTGARPFTRDSELSVVFAHLNEVPPRPSELRTDLPAAFDEVIAVALAKAPDDRFQSCGELAEAAFGALRGKVRVRRRSPRRRLLAAATAVAVTCGAIGGYLATRGEPSHAARGAAVASGPVSAAITQTAIAGAGTGRTADFYERRFGGYRYARLAGPPNYPSYAFQVPSVEVYFPESGRHAIIVTTWNRQYRTARGIGPCSTLAEMKKAYGSAVKPSWAGTLRDGSVHSYVVGDNLLFATDDMRTISAVALYRGNHRHTRGGSPQAYANYIAANETACVAG